MQSVQMRIFVMRFMIFVSLYVNLNNELFFHRTDRAVRRIIAINVQGLTGKKKDFTSLPYSKIQVYSVETSGVFDLDSELELWFSGVGKVKFEFTSNSNVSEICKSISNYVLE